METNRQELREFILENWQYFGEATISSNIDIGYPNIPAPAEDKDDEDDENEDVSPSGINQVDLDDIYDTNRTSRGHLVRQIQVGA